jgi:hypothetical protein
MGTSNFPTTCGSGSTRERNGVLTVIISKKLTLQFHSILLFRKHFSFGLLQ